MSSNKNTLKIRRFPIDEMKEHRIILVIGKRGTGKSVLLRDIMYRLRKRIDIAFAMSPTLDTIKMFEECLPKSHVFDDYSLEQVQNIMKQMKALKEENKHRSGLLVLDDCMFDKKIMKSTEMREIHMNGRHFNLYFINSMQYVMDMGPDLRSQVDYLFVLKENVISNRQKIHKYFFGMFQDYDEFSLVMDKCTNNHECLVLDNTQPENDLSNCVYYYKANKDLESFRVGRSIYFKLDRYFGRTSEREKKKKRKAVSGSAEDAPESPQHSSNIKLPDPVPVKKSIDVVEKE